MYIYKYIYIYIYIYLFMYPPNKRSFRGPAGVGRGLDSVSGPKLVRGSWPPVDHGTDNMYSSTVSNRPLGPKF